MDAITSRPATSTPPVSLHHRTNTLLIEPSQRLDRRAADQRRPIPSISLFGPYLPQNYKFCTTTENLPPVDNKYYTTLLPHTSLLTSKAVQTNFSACQLEAAVDGLPEEEFCTEETDEYGDSSGRMVIDGAVFCKKHYWKWVDANSL
ncbi:hypothetical protein BC332_23615 [Capsicum chinense]|nr:hypothetical protein BC332_23615 [Capsicum chinense]